MGELAESLMWLMRVAIGAGILWGSWLCVSDAFLPSRSPKLFEMEQFASFALVILALIIGL
jgi:hypothetical protein